MRRYEDPIAPHGVPAAVRLEGHLCPRLVCLVLFSSDIGCGLVVSVDRTPQLELDAKFCFDYDTRLPLSLRLRSQFNVVAAT